jgi:hypothetical protein
MNRHGSMNRHYRLVWNSALGAWIPIAEIAPNRRRGSGAARSVAVTLALVVPLAQASPGVAGGTEVGGLVGLNGGWNGTYRGGEYGKGGITGSFATGSVKGATDVGGLVGFNGGGNGSYGIIGIVNDSYASGLVR